MNMRHVPILCFALLLSSCSPPPATRDPLVTLIQLSGPDDETVVLHVEIADEQEERQIGLMFRQDLENGYGMLFIFDEPETLSFWMKNTLIPLDIIFFAGDGSFVSRATMEPCREDPCPTYESIDSAKYALEVPAGDPAVSRVGSGWTILHE